MIPLTGHPVGEGRLCHRGWNRYQNLRSVNRIDRPRIRDGSGFKEVSWEKALQKTADRIRGLLDRYGPESIGVIGSPWLTNEDNFRLSRFCIHVLSSKNLDGSFRFAGASALTALGSAFSYPFGSLGTIPRLKECPSILVVGGDSHRDFSPVGSRIIQAFLRGSKVVLADATVARKEHFYAAHLPYTLQQLPIALAEKSDILDDVQQCLSHKGLGLVFVADQVHPASSLISLLGLLSRLSNLEDSFPEILPLSRAPNLRGAWDMEIRPDEEGLNLHEMLERDDGIKGILIFADDLLTHLPSEPLVERLKSLEFVLVADRFNTETCRIAHCVLPLPLLAESEGTMTNCEGRVQKLRSALPPPAETRSVQKILSDLSQKVGSPLPDHVDFEVRKEMSRCVPGYQQVSDESALDSLPGVLLPGEKQLSAGAVFPESASSSSKSETFTFVAIDTLYGWNRNQMILESPVLAIEYPLDPMTLCISAADARALKLRMGETVTVRSKEGEVRLPVQPNEDVPVGMILLASHWKDVLDRLAGKGSVDTLTGSVYYPALSVTVEKI